MNDTPTRAPLTWYAENFERYASFTRLLHATIENIIRSAKVDHLSVTSRTKSIASFSEKIKRKSYTSVDHATDLAGIRVITFIETDAQAAADLLKSSFVVHPEKSLDKSEELGESQVGYRSIHLICELGQDRIALPEYSPFAGMTFEIQVRTALQHAWAEIDHDRSYKFGGILPPDLRRRFNLLAGQLELADHEFSRLAKDVEEHRRDLEAKSATNDLDIELSSDSLIRYLETISSQHELSIGSSSPEKFGTVIDELTRFGIEKVADFDKLVTPQFIADLKAHRGATSQIGLIRKLMMYEDMDRYFTDAYRHSWSGMTQSTRQLLEQKWGKRAVQDALKRFIRPSKQKTS